MDNLTHTLVGAALAETGLKRATPLAAATLLIGANLPDIDILSGAFGPLTYLEYHRGLTHSLVGFLGLAVLLAASVYGCSRLARPRANPGARHARFGPLLALSLLSMATHPLLDYTNNYGWRPFLPWNNRWYYGDIAFVVDPWIWAGLGGWVFVVTAKTHKRALGWALLFAACTFFIVSAGVSLKVVALWLAVAALAVALRLMLGLNERRERTLTAGMLIILLTYFGTLTLLHRLALDKAAALAANIITTEPVRQINAMPM